MWCVVSLVTRSVTAHLPAFWNMTGWIILVFIAAELGKLNFHFTNRVVMASH